MLVLILTKSNSDLSSSNWGFFYLLVFIFFGIFIGLIAKITTIIKWRKSIKLYLDSLEKYKNFELIATEKTLTILMDNDETQEKWTEIRKSEFNDDYISLKGNLDYFIPKKSMSQMEFEDLKDIIRTKINE